MRFMWLFKESEIRPYFPLHLGTDSFCKRDVVRLLRGTG